MLRYALSLLTFFYVGTTPIVVNASQEEICDFFHAISNRDSKPQSRITPVEKLDEQSFFQKEILNVKQKANASKNLWGRSSQKEFSIDNLVRSAYLKPGEKSFLQQQRELIQDKTFTLSAILLFSGTDIFSQTIRAITQSNFSHCGVELTDQFNKQYVLESTGSASQILKDHIMPQVQIHSLEIVNSNYSGGIWRRPVNYGDKKPDSMIIKQFLDEDLGRPYERSVFELVKAVYGLNSENNTKTLFCSEMNAKLFESLGYLPADILFDNCIPAQFAGEAKQRSLPWQNGVSFGKIEEIKSMPSTWRCTIL